MEIRDIMLAIEKRFAKANGLIEVDTNSDSRKRYIKPTWDEDNLINEVPKIEVQFTDISCKLSYEEIGSSFFLEYKNSNELWAFFAYGDKAFRIASNIKNDIDQMIINKYKF